MLLLKKIIGYGLVAAIGTLLTTQLVAALREGSVAEHSACLGLDPEPLGKAAQDFVLPDLAGRKQALLAPHKGKAVLLHFWFTRCPPCIEELPSLMALQREMQGQDFSLVTVSVDEKAEEVSRFLAQYRITELPVRFDPDKKTSRAFGTDKFPESYLIDRAGVARYRFVNKRNWASPVARACIESVM